MSLDWKVVPIETWPGELTKDRTRSRFRAGWERSRSDTGLSTVELLEREIAALDGKDVLMQMAVRPQDIRLDGKVRANARPAEHPGVIITFDSNFGPLSYPCDAFDDWQDNVRAIALSLEALRKVDRYGVSRRGEQYSGWGKLPPAGGTTATMGARTAAEILVDQEQLEGDPDDLLEHWEAARLTYRHAARNAHPDRHGGDGRRMALVNQARDVLARHHGRK